MRKLGFMKKVGFIIGIIVLLMAVMPMSDGLVVQAVPPDLEYGDAPDPPYPSNLSSNGSRHQITETEILGLFFSMGDLKDWEMDANVPDLDAFDDGLVTFVIAANDPAANVTFEVTNWVGSDLWVNILIDLNGNGNWTDAGEHVVQNQAIFLPAVAEATFVSTPFSTMGATPGPTWLRLTLTRVPIGTPWDGTVFVPFEYGETEDHEIWIEAPADLPDLQVVEKYEIVEGCMYWVTYIVYNAGNATAGNSTTCIYADHKLVDTAPCPPLLVGEWNETTVGPYDCPGNTTVWIMVEADNYDDVAESNEGNNYWENLMEQPLEFGDAADPTYPSLLASDGSRHCPTDTEILGLGLSGQDCKDFELDALIIDNDACCDGLVTTTLASGNATATVTFEVTNNITTDNLIVNILIDLNIDGDWTDAGEHVVQNQAIPLPGPDDNTFNSTPFSTVGAIPGPTWLRLTLSRTPVTVPWDGTGLFACGETEDWNITIEEEEPEGWYYKPNQTDYAPSGMPDFDQKQDNWTNPPVGGPWTYCGPTAVANSLWWFDSANEPFPQPPSNISDHYGLVTNFSNPWDDHNASNVIPLVNNLSWLMDTDGNRTGSPHNGTDVYDMEQGIRDYLNATGYNDSYYVVTAEMPDFFWIEEEVERCEDVILLLGFWTAEDDYMPPEMWWRIGGHYVTCAGVNSSGMQLAISDPFLDNAGAGGPGRVPVNHTYPHNASVHNDTQYVSHDTYDVNISFTPGGLWALENYAAGNPMVANFMGQNANPNLMLPTGLYLGPQFPLRVEIEYAVAVSPTGATLEGHVDFGLVRGGPPPNAKWIEPFVVRGFEPGNLTNELWTQNATTNDTGVFTIAGLAPGTYDISIKNWTCLSEVNTSVTLGAGNTTVVNFGTVRQGDADNNDYVVMADLGAMLPAWNKQVGDPEYRVKFDFNRDGYVTMADLGVMLPNWSQKGDLVP